MQNKKCVRPEHCLVRWALNLDRQMPWSGKKLLAGLIYVPRYMYHNLLSITGTLLFHSGHLLYNFTLDTTNIICQTVMRQNILHNTEFILNQFLAKMSAKCGFNLIYERNINQQQQGIALFFHATLVFESPNLVHHSWIFI